jgi:hypothetical protein
MVATFTYYYYEHRGGCNLGGSEFAFNCHLLAPWSISLRLR